MRKAKKPVKMIERMNKEATEKARRRENIVGCTVILLSVAILSWQAYLAYQAGL